MSNALLSDVRARAEARRVQTRDQQWQELAQAAWHGSLDAAASGDAAGALRWLERARRLLPKDGMVAFALATARMQAGDTAGAAALFHEVATRQALPEAWAGLATCACLLGDIGRAANAVASALRASIPTPTLQALAEAVAPAAGHPGWCGLDGDGFVHVGATRGVRVMLDGTEAQPAWSGGRGRLPWEWRGAGVLQVDCCGVPCLGSPIGIGAITRIEGVVEALDGGLQGWAWHPADPARNPVLMVGERTVVATDAAEDIKLDRPLGRARRFAVPAAALDGHRGAVSVRALNGRHLLGSPLDPGLEGRTAATLARAVHQPGPAPTHAPILADIIAPRPLRPAARPRPVDVVIPVHGGRLHTLACLDSVLATVARGVRVWVIDDASPDPELIAALVALANRRHIRLIRQPENLGFPAAANAGLSACAPRDAVLLNSDTLVPPGWLDRLRNAAYSTHDIGTVTPLSNDGSIVSYPDPAGGNAVPDLAATVAADAVAQRAGHAAIDIPSGVGFCLYLRRDCLDETGLFREDSFAQGYGEENDLCLRARHLGWRSVAAPNVFVAHVGGQSFGSARRHLVRRNLVVLNRLHPGYDAVVAAHVAADPLAPARRRMDALRWAVGRSSGGAAIIVTHAGGGGVDRVVADRVATLSASGLRTIIVRPGARQGTCVVEAGGVPYPNLTYTLPDDLPDLARLLREDRPRHLEVHHLLGHSYAVLGLARLLRIPVDVFVHDYASFCPRISLVGAERRYCGEPDVAGCEGCIADNGSSLLEDVTVPALVERSAHDLAAARQVIAPSQDAAARIRRHFPSVAPIVHPWEDARLAPPEPSPARAVRRICVVGAIGIEKGYDVLLACARDARARALPLEFVVVGYTTDDTRLMAAGPVFVTGEYAEADAVALVRAQQADLAFIPSVCPETWCFALSRAWQAGLSAAVFDLGAQAERVRAAGRGWLLPLGLQSQAVNDALLTFEAAALPRTFRPQSTRTRLAPAFGPTQCAGE